MEVEQFEKRPQDEAEENLANYWPQTEVDCANETLLRAMNFSNLGESNTEH